MFLFLDKNGSLAGSLFKGRIFFAHMRSRNFPQDDDAWACGNNAWACGTLQFLELPWLDRMLLDMGNLCGRRYLCLYVETVET